MDKGRRAQRTRRAGHLFEEYDEPPERLARISPYGQRIEGKREVLMGPGRLVRFGSNFLRRGCWNRILVASLKATGPAGAEERLRRIVKPGT